MFMLSTEIFFWSNKSLISPLFLFAHPCKWSCKCVVSYYLIALSLLLQWLQIAHGIPFIVFCSKSLTTKVSLCFLLDCFPLVRFIAGDGGFRWTKNWILYLIGHCSSLRERNCFLLTEKDRHTNLFYKTFVFV